MATDYYELLGVSRNATEEELKKAYRRLARELHPDTSGGSAESESRFKEVTLAYETLRDPERRRRYDMFGPDSVRGSGAGAGSAGGNNPFGFGANLGDVFDVFFGGGGGFSGQSRQGVRRGGDAEVVLELALVEAAFGADREIRLTMATACVTCEGSGARPGTSPTPCPDCRGSGQVQRVRQSFLGQMVTSSACNRCDGSGEVVASPCSDCRGQGRRNEERALTVTIPPGVDTGSTLRVQGGGQAALRGGVPGDLYVHLRVAPDGRFDRAGDDLVAALSVSFAQAALGTSVEIETLDGSERVVVAPGTQSGTVIRFGGRGVPRLRSRGRGDLLVQVVVDTPTKLAKDEEALLRQLAQLRGEDVAEPDHGMFSRLRSKIT